MKLKNRIPIVLAALAAVPIVYAQNTPLLQAEEPIAVSLSAPDEATHTTLAVRETSLTMNDDPQPIYHQYLKALMSAEGTVS